MRRLVLGALLLAACGDNLPSPYLEPHAASVRATVEVTPEMATAPFDQPRTLLLPPGFGIRVVARIPLARFLAETPEGDLLVSQPSEGKILRISRLDGQTFVDELRTGLTLPHDLVFTTIAGTTYLYISETHRISRTPWTGTGSLGALEPIVDGLPSASLPELMGNYGHALKNIAIAGDQLFVSVASATNSDPADVLATPARGAVHVFDLAGGNGRLYASGIRNAEGLAIHPRTGELWVAVNHRDNLRYPYMDGVHPYGELVQDYVNDNPPEPFTRVRDGGNYGWPYCNPTARDGIDDMTYVVDIDNNADNATLDCTAIDTIDKGLPAHSAPLGMAFWTGAQVPVGYRDGAVLGLHGCWNCSVPRGYKVAFLAMAPEGEDPNEFADPIDLVSGFLDDPSVIQSAWGRPVDVIPNRAGNLYISDDRAGAVYELYRRE